MHINKNFIKIFSKYLIIIALLEGVYLYAVPAVLNNLAGKNYIKNFISQKTNICLNYDTLTFKTHIIPAVTVNILNLDMKNKINGEDLINSKNLNLKINILPLFLKKLNLQEINSIDLNINLIKDKDGNFNFQKLLNSKGKQGFKTSLKEAKINVYNYCVNLKDENLLKNIELSGKDINIKINSQKNKISVKLDGKINTNNETLGELDIDFSSHYPITKTFDKDLISGHLFAYNINLKDLEPFIQMYSDKNLKALDGFIEYLQISSDINENNNNQIVLNTSFKDVLYSRSDWKNNVTAKNTNKLNIETELKDKEINIKSLNYTADNVNIKADGNINLKDTPELDINAEIQNSRAENIASILPPNLVPKYMTIEKVKSYGVFGDLEAKVHVKGKIPQPDITGYVKGRNVHILDKSIHKLHKGTIDITFDNRILNMNIIVDLFNKQRADVTGSVHMYRDGINHVIVKTTNNIDFPLAQKIIVPISKVFNFQLGPIPDMTITSGKGIIDMDIKGSLELIDINGYSSFDKGEVTYNGLYGQAKNVKGRLDFNKDVVSFKSEKAYVKNNPLSAEGFVKINDKLDFNILSPQANVADVMEIINKSSLLKDVKAGIAVITKANGNSKLNINIKSDIVPVPFGQPPLPPEEAFENMKVKGSIYLFNDECFIEGFYTPIKAVKGIVDFTEEEVKLNDLTGISGSSPIKISGKILTDLQTKIPDVDITVTSKSVNLKDTVKFLTESYLYPKNYPDISPLYNIASKHDLYFKYKAKSIDFITDKAYAEMNFIKDDSPSKLKAQSGKVILDKSSLKLENIIADLYNAKINISGNIQKIDTLHPIYNLNIKSDKFNIANLNDTSKLTVLPDRIKNILNQFKEYTGFCDINLIVKKNIMDGRIKFNNLKLKHIQTNALVYFDDFIVNFNNKKLYLENLTAQIGDSPFYGNLTISDVFTNPYIEGYFTSKITNNFITEYMPQAISEKIGATGDINLSAKIKGNQNNLNIIPKLTLNVDSDISIDGTSLGETTDKREFEGNININKDIINISKFNYIKYITSQNNKTNPIIFASGNAILKINQDKIITPEEIYIKTYKNISARILNLFLKEHILTHGTINCDLKYRLGKLTGNLDCQNLDIPLFDTLIKNIKLSAKNETIDLNIFGFLADSKIHINSIIDNHLTKKPKINSLNIYADEFDNNKFFDSLAKTHKAMNTNNNIKNIDLSGLSLDKGHLAVKKVLIKSLEAENLKSNFSINDKGIFLAKDMEFETGSGNITGGFLYNLNDTSFNGSFELNNVDSNYIAETLFDGKNQIYGNANGKIILSSKGSTNEEIVKNLSGFIYFEILDGRMPKLGSLEYLLRASNIIKSGITGLTLNSILEILNLVKTGYFSNINGSCKIDSGIADDIEIYSTGENLSLYIHGKYDLSNSQADMEILGKLSKKISTIFGAIGNTSLNTFFKLIPGISMLDFGRKDFIEDVEKIPPFTNGDYESRTFQAIINGDINSSKYVQSFKWVK